MVKLIYFHIFLQSTFTVCVKDYSRFYINIQTKIIVCAYKFYAIIGGRKFERHATTTQTSDAIVEIVIGTGRSKKCQFLSLSIYIVQHGYGG